MLLSSSVAVTVGHMIWSFQESMLTPPGTIRRRPVRVSADGHLDKHWGFTGMWLPEGRERSCANQ